MAGTRKQGGPTSEPASDHGQSRGRPQDHDDAAGRDGGAMSGSDADALQEAATRLARRNALSGLDDRLGRALDEDSIGQNEKELEAPAGAGEGLRDAGRYGGQDAPMAGAAERPPTARIDTGREGVLAAGGGDGTRGTDAEGGAGSAAAPGGPTVGAAPGDDPLRPLTEDDDAAMVPRTRPRDDDRVGHPSAYGGMGRFARRGAIGHGPNDGRIQDAICERLAQLPDLDATEVVVNVRDGRVVLEGSVPAQYMKDQLDSRTRDVDGVEEVDDRVRVGLGPDEPLRTPGEIGRRHI